MKGALLLAGMVIGFAYVVAKPHRTVVTAPSTSQAGGFTVGTASVPQNISSNTTIVPGEPMLSTGNETVVPRAFNGHFYTDADINGQPVHMVVDTGATGVALTIGDAQRLGIPFDPANFQVIGGGASGAVRGAIVTLGDVAVGGKHASNVDAAVIEGLEISLLGQSYLRHLDNVEISGDTMHLR